MLVPAEYGAIMFLVFEQHHIKKNCFLNTSNFGEPLALTVLMRKRAQKAIFPAKK